MAEKKRGRPSVYTQEIADEICRRLAEGQTLKEIGRDPKMPSDVTIRQWSTFDTEGFYSQYAKAREAGYALMAEEILEIADKGSNDWMERNDPENPGYAFNGEHYQRSRLRVDTRKWMLSKVLPKIYGDKVAVDVTHKLADLSDDELDAQIAADLGDS